MAWTKVASKVCRVVLISYLPWSRTWGFPIEIISKAVWIENSKRFHSCDKAFSTDNYQLGQKLTKVTQVSSFKFRSPFSDCTLLIATYPVHMLRRGSGLELCGGSLPTQALEVFDLVVSLASYIGIYFWSCIRCWIVLCPIEDLCVMENTALETLRNQKSNVGKSFLSQINQLTSQPRISLNEFILVSRCEIGSILKSIVRIRD